MILRYTDKVQQQLNSKAKPEPWLHCGIANNKYVIYVWDTRQVVEVGLAPNEVTGSIANDNHLQLQGLHKNFSNLNIALGFGVTNTEQIKQMLTSLPEPKRTIACLKAIVVIYLQQSPAERDKNRHARIDGIGFSQRHIRPMNQIARTLLKRSTLLNQDQVRYAKNVAPMYAGQLAKLANACIRYIDADEVEKWLRGVLRGTEAYNCKTHRHYCADFATELAHAKSLAIADANANAAIKALKEVHSKLGDSVKYRISPMHEKAGQWRIYVSGISFEELVDKFVDKAGRTKMAMYVQY